MISPWPRAFSAITIGGVEIATARAGFYKHERVTIWGGLLP